MHCINDDCEVKEMRVKSVFKGAEKHLRAYVCPVCKWETQSVESLVDQDDMPKIIEHLKKQRRCA